MTKEDFLKLNREIGQAPPIDTVRIEYMEAQFLKLGLSIENGYKAVQYFYNELQNAINEKETIFKGKVSYVDDWFAISDGYACIFKMKVIDFEKRKNIFYQIREKEGNDLTKAKKIEEAGFSVPTYALYHVYLSIYNGVGVTQQNKTPLAKKYKYKNGTQLRNDFTKFQDKEKRIEINVDNTKSARTHLKRFTNILPYLKIENIQAFKLASEEYEHVLKYYNKHKKI